MDNFIFTLKEGNTTYKQDAVEVSSIEITNNNNDFLFICINDAHFEIEINKTNIGNIEAFLKVSHEYYTEINQKVYDLINNN
jgi:hypothetical protein